MESAAVRLGGEFALLSQSESRHRMLLHQAETLAENAEKALLVERSKTVALTSAAVFSGELASDAAVAAEAAQRECTRLENHATSAQIASQSLYAEVAALEASEVAMALEARDHSATQVETQAALEAAQARIGALEVALGAHEAEADSTANREREMRRELDEWRERAKRATAARSEKEKQIAVLLNEKNRLSALLSKKDALARGLSSVLKQQEEKKVAPTRKAAASARVAATATPGALAALAAATPETSATLASPAMAAAAATAAAAAAQPDEADAAGRIAAAATVAAAAAAASERGAAGLPAGSSASASGWSTPRHSGRWPTQDESIVSPRLPGVQSRFEGWRTATPEQRGAALRSENSVLLGVIAERDVALHAAHAELSKLRADHDALLVRYRNGRKGAPSQSSAHSAGRGPALAAEPRTPRTPAAAASATTTKSPVPDESPA